MQLIQQKQSSCSLGGSPSPVLEAAKELVAVEVTSHQGGASEVLVSGTFNGWGTPVPMTGSDGEFKASLLVPPKPHQIKFLVDGEWKCDASLPTTFDADGNLNNVLDPMWMMQMARARDLDGMEFMTGSDRARLLLDVSLVFEFAPEYPWHGRWRVAKESATRVASPFGNEGDEHWSGRWRFDKSQHMVFRTDTKLVFGLGVNQPSVVSEEGITPLGIMSATIASTPSDHSMLSLSLRDARDSVDSCLHARLAGSDQNLWSNA